MSHSVSIVICTYEERHNIGLLIDRIRDIAASSPLISQGSEIIIVDDNSPDGTGEFCKSMAEKDGKTELRVFVRTEERGLASAVKRGITESNGDIVVIMDADFSHDPSVIPALLKPITSNHAEVAVGSRFIQGGGMESSIPHVLGSRLLNWFIVTLLRIPVADVTGGFLAIKKSALRGLDLDKIFRGHGDFCFALLYAGMKRGWRIKEIGFRLWPRELGQSKTSFFKAGFSYGIRALRLRAGLERGILQEIN